MDAQDETTAQRDQGVAMSEVDAARIQPVADRSPESGTNDGNGNLCTLRGRGLVQIQDTPSCRGSELTTSTPVRSTTKKVVR